MGWPYSSGIREGSCTGDALEAILKITYSIPTSNNYCYTTTRCRNEWWNHGLLHTGLAPMEWFSHLAAQHLQLRKYHHPFCHLSSEQISSSPSQMKQAEKASMSSLVRNQESHPVLQKMNQAPLTAYFHTYSKTTIHAKNRLKTQIKLLHKVISTKTDNPAQKKGGNTTWNSPKDYSPIWGQGLEVSGDTIQVYSILHKVSRSWASISISNIILAKQIRLAIGKGAVVCGSTEILITCNHISGWRFLYIIQCEFYL